MKSPSSALIDVSFFLLVFTTKPLVSLPIALRDGNGNKVLVDQDYFIRSLTWGAGEGGVLTLPGLNNTCPVDVAWGTRLFFRGIPVRFSPVTDINGIVNTDTNLNINCLMSLMKGPALDLSSAATRGPSRGSVTTYQPGAGKWFITIDGIEGEFGPETYPNCFYIKKVGGTCDYPFYKLVHCPGRNSAALCNDVGVSYEYGGRLVLSKTSFTFIILKNREVGGHSQE
ncbi:latex serine proteinase inhibitor-like [Diospyros lotus]|uniref:latex serine proteinase inhibitor-like n=1 Tax=Diospyros lotus TaxID=55363 RepID=UPI0022564AB5|nr:latex serine proteinase inhibitor-like [Diospyros lotus]